MGVGLINIDGGLNSQIKLVRGYVNYKGILYKSDSPEAHLDELFDDLYYDLSNCSLLSGCFLILFSRNDTLFCITDAIRSFPLYYSVCSSGQVINVAERINSFNGGNVNHKTLLGEFKVLGYCTKNNTLLESIYQAETASVYQFMKGKQVEVKRYFDFEYRKSKCYEPKDLHKVHKLIFLDLLKYVGDRQVVVPLSGGFDSRLIVYLLKELGKNNVFTFTYGKKNNHESKVSKSIADSLDFSWYFVEYTKELWLDFYHKREGKFDEYFDYCSIPHVQDLLAVEYLKKNNIIADNAVFIPGHSADFLEGTHIPPSIFHSGKDVFTSTDFENIIKDKHYNLWKNSKYQCNEISNYFNITSSVSSIKREKLIELTESWNYQERQSKFITNSINLYRKLGYEAFVPFWDKRLIDFWLSVSLEERNERKFYLKYAEVYDYYYQVKMRNLDVSNAENFKSKLKKSKYFNLIKKLYILLYNLNHRKTDYVGFFHQYNKLRLYWGFILGAKSVNSFVVKDIISYCKKK